MAEVSRRTLTRAVAWSAPVVLAAVAAPAVSVSILGPGNGGGGGSGGTGGGSGGSIGGTVVALLASWQVSALSAPGTATLVITTVDNEAHDPYGVTVSIMPTSTLSSTDGTVSFTSASPGLWAQTVLNDGVLLTGELSPNTSYEITVYLTGVVAAEFTADITIDPTVTTAYARTVAQLPYSGVEGSCVYLAQPGRDSLLRVTLDGEKSDFATGRIATGAGVAVDAAGNVFGAASTSSGVRKITRGGVVSDTYLDSFSAHAVAVNSSGAIAFLDGSSKLALFIPGTMTAIVATTELIQPTSVAISESGDVYVADAGTNSIVKVVFAANNQTSSQSVFASGLNIPVGVAIGPSGEIYVADAGNNRVLKYASGTQSEVGSALFSPSSVALSATGDVYIVDSGVQGRLVKVTAAGSQSVVATGFGTVAGIAFSDGI